jgi:hypothetical protein
MHEKLFISISISNYHLENMKDEIDLEWKDLRHVAILYSRIVYCLFYYDSSKLSLTIRLDFLIAIRENVH